MRRPLRSKRAITSPLRARSKASGLTRIRVRLTAGASFLFFGSLPLRGAAAGRGRFFPPWLFWLFRLFLGLGLTFGGAALARLRLGLALGALGLGLALARRGLRPPLARLRLGAALARLLAALALPAGQGALAVRAEAPARVDWLAAGRAGVLEAALAI